MPGGTCLACAKPHATAPSTTHPITTAIRKPVSDRCTVVILATALLLYPLRFPAAEAPPADLIKRIAHHEAETVEERGNYAYRQTVRLTELNDRGGEVGRYSETRDVVFSPQRERTEKAIGVPFESLKNLKLTEEDFADLRDIQPFTLREDLLFNYEIRFRGEENIDDTDCWVILIRPKQILQNQRFFEGLIWASKKDYAIVRTEGRAVPQIYSTKQENLFPSFTTIRKPVAGNFWFPAVTYADDTLYFRTGPQRIKLMIRYSNYQKFGSSSSVIFDEPEK